MRASPNGIGSTLESRSGFVLVALLAALACAGPPGKEGPPGSASDAGNPNSPGTIDYGVLTPAELEVAKMTAEVTGVTIPADGRPVVQVKVTERHGSGVKGMSATAVTWRFALIKLTQGVNGSGNDSWVSYMPANDHTNASTESATTGLTDHGDGTYTYQFAKVITGGPGAAGTTYEPSKVHRLVILLYATGNPFTPINLVKDFVPSTGADVTDQNEKVDRDACLECHTQFRAIAGATGELGSGEFHGGVRYDVRTCAACHNDQKRFAVSGNPTDSPAIAANGTWTGNLTVLNNEAILNFPVFIHKIHMGEELKMTGGKYTGFTKPYEVTYPQDVRNCVKCHRVNERAPLADNWKNAPSRRACNACHDNISFVNPAPNGRQLHTGGAVATDNCLLCHAAGGTAVDIPGAHIPVSPPNPNNIYLNTASGNSNTNAAYVAAAGAVPSGAKVITYDVSSVSVAGGNPQIVFRFMMADPNANPPVPPTPVVFPAFGGGVTEMIPNFVGSPSAYFVYALPQDGVTAPADFNASASGYLRNIWNGTATGAGAGTLSAPDGNGYYTVKLTGVTIPASATMLTGGIGYTYSLGSAPSFTNNNQPLTQINLPAYPYTPNAPPAQGGKGGLIVPAPDIWKVATGYTARRTVVANAKCQACHVALGVGPDFHAGQRNDATSCNFCHNPNRTSSGWSANQKDFIHSIHGAEKRAVPFNWHAPSATQGYYQVTYPAVLNRCEMCHLPGTYDFSLASTTAALPNMLYSTVAQGRFNRDPATNPGGYYTISPYVFPPFVPGGTSTASVDFGYGFSTAPVNYNLPDGVSGTQNGGTVACTPTAPCFCTAANPCTVVVDNPVTIQGVNVTFKQGSTTCSQATPCTCVTDPAPPAAATKCTGTVATCSPSAPCQAQSTTLVNSPIAAACSACHDSAAAVDHMQTNGASFWEPRATAFSKPQKEQCLICHGPNRVAAISLVHQDRTP